MVNIKTLFSNAIIIASFILLQLLAHDTFGPNCFVYIGSIIFLDWSRNNCIWHMLCAFFIGVFIDIACHTLGVHTFSLVLLAYIKHYLLVLLVPGYNRDIVEMTIPKLGISKVVLYTAICTIVFYIALFVLSLCKNISFTTGLLWNSFLCASILFLCQIIIMMISWILDAR